MEGVWKKMTVDDKKGGGSKIPKIYMTSFVYLPVTKFFYLFIYFINLPHKTPKIYNAGKNFFIYSHSLLTDVLETHNRVIQFLFFSVYKCVRVCVCLFGTQDLIDVKKLFITFKPTHCGIAFFVKKNLK